MDEALHRRLDSIERRQRWIIALLGIPYLLFVGQFVVMLAVNNPNGVVVFVIVTAVLTLLGLGYAGYRARQPSRR